ncbi:MAG: hypothetical protein AAB639_01845, partial [Patescibacteria group bacterium]
MNVGHGPTSSLSWYITYVEQSLLGKILAKISLAIIIVALLDLLYLNWLVLSHKSVKKETVAASPTLETDVASPSPTPSSAEVFDPEAQTRRATEGKPAEEAKTVETKTVVTKETQTIVQTAQKEIFIPMGSGSTKSHDFADLTSTDVTIDTSKYANIQSVVFETSIWVEGGNGAAYAQLYNVSDKTGYIESQVSNNIGTAVVKVSGNLPLPVGQKTYRVRAKTDIVEFAAHVSNA